MESGGEPLDIAAQCFPLWARDFGVIPDTDGPPSFIDRPYLDELYDNEARESVYRKANQVGLTSMALLRAVWGATHHWPKGVGYFLPHDRQVGDFVRQKLNPILARLPFAYAPTDTDNVGMKSLARGDMFIRGIASEDNRQTFSADAYILDERDLMLQEHVDDVANRLEASDFKVTIEISRPSTPGYGIDGSFEKSTQNYWTMACEACHKDWTIEDSWPECCKGEPLQMVCPKCGAAADVKAGRWIARKKADVVGYTINGVLNPHVDLGRFMTRYQEKPGVFWRASMGMPFIEEGTGVRMKAILSYCGLAARAESDAGICFGGSDVGDEGHVVIYKKGPNVPEMVTCFRWKDWSELDAAMTRYNIGCMVVDALPDKRGSRAFCQRWRGRAFMCYYDRNRRGAARWNERELTLNMDRTESLDASHTPLYTGAIVLPKQDPEVREFARQCENEVRIIDELPDGNTIARWDMRGKNHYRHAHNYGWAAMTREMRRTVMV